MKTKMKYTERIQNQGEQQEKALELLGQRSKLQAQADLLEVKSQISDKEADVERLRLAEGKYSLTKVGEALLELKDLKAVYAIMEEEFTSEFGG